MELILKKTIKTKRLLLRPLAAADLHTAHTYLSDLQNTQYNYYLPYKSLEETKARLELYESEWAKVEPDFFEFAVLLDGMHIGGVSAYYYENDRTKISLGWIINKEFWGHGYATEASIALKDYLLQNLSCKTLTAHCDAANTASLNVAQKIGMKLINSDGTRTYRDERGSAREIYFEYTV